MLSGIFDILKSIGDFFLMLGRLIVTLITDGIEIISLIIRVPSLISDSLSWFPDIILTFIISIMAFLVIMRILKYYGD